MNILCRR